MPEFFIQEGHISHIEQISEIKNLVYGHQRVGGAPLGALYALREGTCFIASRPPYGVVGYAYATGGRYGNPEATIGDLVVHPKSRRRGIEETLLEKLCEVYTSEGVRSDDRMVKVYENAGFGVEDTSLNDGLSYGITLVKVLQSTTKQVPWQEDRVFDAVLDL